MIRTVSVAAVACATLLAVAAFADDSEPVPVTSESPAPNAPAPQIVPAQPSAAVKWDVLPDKSTVEWNVIYGSKPVNGGFSQFKADITFDPEHLDTSAVNVQVDTASVISDDKDAAEVLPGADWFNSTAFPKAVFESKTFRRLADGQYEAEGNLTLAGKTMPVVLPFTVHFYDDNESSPPVRYAQMTGEVMLKRTQFALGKGDWAGTDVLADDVKVTIGLKAKQAKAP